MYESPITMMMNNIARQQTEEKENYIFTQITERYALSVNKEELIKALNYDRNQYEQGYADAKAIFERPKGRWIDMSSGYAFNDKCSKCGFVVHEQFINDYHFCPNCGARMDGEQE